MNKTNKTLSHNGDYASKTNKVPTIELPRLWAAVCIPTGQVLGVDIFKSRADAILRMIPSDLRNNYVVWRYDPHDYKVPGVALKQSVSY